MGVSPAGGAGPKAAIQKYLKELERDADNPRLSMVEQLKKYQATD